MRNGSKLKARQEQAVLVLLETPTIAAAANKIGVNESTLRRWRADPEFQQAMEEARRDAFGDALCRLQAGAGKAVDALLAVVDDDQAKPSARISAARALLEHGHRAKDALELRHRRARRLVNEKRAAEVELEAREARAWMSSRSGERAVGAHGPLSSSEEDDAT